MAESFTRKIIEVELLLLSGDFGGGNTKTIQGLPVVVQVTKPGPPENNTANVSITGLKYEDLEQLTTLSFQALEAQKNLIAIRAGDQDGSLNTVFEGEIASAFADFNKAPDVSLEVEAITGFYPQRLDPKPLSVNGEVQAADLIAQFAGEAGYAFVNNGVAASVRNAVFKGSPVEKMRQVAKQVGVELLIDDNTVILLESGGVRQGAVPLLSAESGMLGYPTFNQDGIVGKCLYRPDIELGGLVKVESIVPRATGTWKVTRLEHSLTAFKPDGGPWETSFEGQYIG